MNSVTCQARGERHRSLTPGELRADGSAGISLRPSWGSQATPARRAGTAHTARAPRQPIPATCARGTLTPAANAALMPSEVEYTLVMMPARPGNSRLTRLGKSTLATAIADPRTTVPKNRAATASAQRNRIPAARTSRLASSTRSMPNRRATRGAIGESRPKARSGNVVRSPATPLDIPVSARIWPIKGATPVSAGRRLAASSTIPNIRRRLRRRERPDSAVGEVLFVKLRLPVTLQWQHVAYSTWRRVDRRSEEHTSELQSRQYLVCRLLLEKKNRMRTNRSDARYRSNHNHQLHMCRTEKDIPVKLFSQRAIVHSPPVLLQ